MESGTSIPVADSTWVRAKEFHRSIGHIPSLFSSCIRTINKIEAVIDPTDTEVVRDVAMSSAEFLVRVSPTLQSVFYFAAKRLYPDAHNGGNPHDVRSLLEPFAPREVATMLALVFLYRRLAKKCPAKDWMILSRKIQTQLEIGYYLGKNMELVGPSHGLLLGGIRFLSIATFAAHKPDLYAAIKKQIPSNRIFSLDVENEIAGCNHLQIASLIVQSLGFCMPRSNASMSLGLDSLGVSDAALPPRLRGQILSWKAAMSAIEMMHKSGELIARGEDYELKLPPTDEASLRVTIAAATRSPSFQWIARTKKDLPESVAHALKGGHAEDELE